MVSLLDIEFNYNGEWLKIADYIDRIMGTKHPIRTKKEEERAAQDAIERPILAIYRSACGRLLACNAADYIKSEIASVVDIVRRYTWLSEDAIWKLAYEILLWKTSSEGEG